MAGIGDLRGRAIITDGATATLRAIKAGLDQVGNSAQRVGTSTSQYLGNIGRSAQAGAQKLHERAVAINTTAASAGLGFAGIIAATRDFNEAKFGYGLAQIPEYMKDGQFNAAGLKTEMGQAALKARALAREFGVLPDASMKALEEVQKIGIKGHEGESLWRAALGLSMADKDLASGEAVKYLGAMYRSFAKQREAEAKAAGIDPNDPLFINKWIKGIAAKSAMAAADSALSPRDLVEGLRQYAPQWAQFGISPEFAMSALAHGSNYGFRAPELGTAFKSMASRAIAPTNEGLRWFNALGIDRSKFMNLDAADPTRALNQLNSLLGGQLSYGKGGKERMQEVRQMLEEAQKSGTTATPEFQERLTGHITDKLGRKGELDVQEIQQAVSNATLTSGGKVDLQGLIKELVSKGAGPAAMMAIFEKRHYARGTPMFEFYDKMIEGMIRYQAVNGSALDAVTQTRKDSEAGKTDQLFAALKELLLTMEETGAIDAAKDAILGLAEALRKLPPEAVQFGTTALLVAGGLAAVGVALAGIKTVLQLTGMLALAKGAGGMAARALGMGGAAAAAGAAGGGAAVGAAGGAVARRALLGRAASMFIPGVGWVLGAASLGAGGYAAYEEYQRSGSLGSAAKAGAWGALTLGMGSNSAQASEAPRSSGSGQSDMAQSLGIGNIEGFAQREAQSRQASEAMAQALSESANGIRAGGFDMVAGMNDAAGGIRGGGRDVASALLEAASAIRSAAQQLAAGAAGAARVPLNTGRGMGAASTY